MWIKKKLITSHQKHYWCHIPSSSVMRVTPSQNYSNVYDLVSMVSNWHGTILILTLTILCSGFADIHCDYITTATLFWIQAGRRKCDNKIMKRVALHDVREIPEKTWQKETAYYLFIYYENRTRSTETTNATTIICQIWQKSEINLR